MTLPDDLQRGRQCYERGAWSDAYDALRRADDEASLDAGDIERLGIAAYLLGRETEFERYFDRLHRAHLDSGEGGRAARAASWIALSLLLRGQAAQSNAWVARGQRLVEDSDGVERGYLLSVVAERQLVEGQDEAARDTAVAAVAVGRRFRDADLISIALHLQARALVQLDEVTAGLDLLDETMLPVVAGELSPMVTGLMYCSVIAVCRAVHELSRAREWTLAFSRWCDRLPEAVAFSGTCLVNRAEIRRFQGAWPDALADTFLACERAARANRKPPRSALYQRAEIHRLRGEQTKAEEAYRAASELGHDPQPGLALLRLAQGQTEAACAAMRRTLQGMTDRAERARLLPSCVEVMLAAGNLADAHAACRELHAIAEALDANVLYAAAAQCAGAIELAEGRAGAALAPLRRAFELWTRLEVPYDAARARVLIALACRALGDEETATMELAAAGAAFRQLEASADLARVERLERRPPPEREAKLSPREHEVLRLIAAGHTNKAIALHLNVSERTVDRHVSNIFSKLAVPSRAAATAYAYEHELF